MQNLPKPVFLALSWRSLVRTLADRIGATLVILLTGPLLLFIALLIRLESRGPVIERRPHYVDQKQTLYLWTFRTRNRMVPGSARTKLGGTLEQTGLMSLPKVIDVLTGRLALFGVQPAPRPYRQTPAPLRYYGPGLICATVISSRPRSRA